MAKKQMFIKTDAEGIKWVFRFEKEVNCFVGKTARKPRQQRYCLDESGEISTKIPTTKIVEKDEMLSKVISSKSFIPGLGLQKDTLGGVVNAGLHNMVFLNTIAEELKAGMNDDATMQILNDVIYSTLEKNRVEDIDKDDIAPIEEHRDVNVNSLIWKISTETKTSLLKKLNFLYEENFFVVSNKKAVIELLEKVDNINDVSARNAGEKIIDIKDASEVNDIDIVRFNVVPEYARKLSLVKAEDNDFLVEKSKFYFEENEVPVPKVVFQDGIATHKEDLFLKVADILNEYNFNAVNPSLKESVSSFRNSLLSDKDSYESIFISNLFYPIQDIASSYRTATGNIFKGNHIFNDIEGEELRTAKFELWNKVKDLTLEAIESIAKVDYGYDLNNNNKALLFTAANIATNSYINNKGELLEKQGNSSFSSTVMKEYYLQWLNKGHRNMEFEIEVGESIPDGYAHILNGILFYNDNLVQKTKFTGEKITAVGEVEDGVFYYSYVIDNTEKENDTYTKVLFLDSEKDLKREKLIVGRNKSFHLCEYDLEDMEDLSEVKMIKGEIVDVLSFNKYDFKGNFEEVVAFVKLKDTKVKKITRSQREKLEKQLAE